MNFFILDSPLTGLLLHEALELALPRVREDTGEPRLLCVECARGQSYPTKPIRIVTAEIGSSADIGGRMITQGISGPLGQPVIVDKRGVVSP